MEITRRTELKLISIYSISALLALKIKCALQPDSKFTEGNRERASSDIKLIRHTSPIAGDKLTLSIS